MKKALIVGGTGATGVILVDAILRRGYDVAIYHRGVHEIAGFPDVEHIHGEPHFAETIKRDLAGRRWDLVVATYGRIRLLAEALGGKTDRLITVSGAPAAKRLPGVPTRESDGTADPGNHLIERIVETEEVVLRGNAHGLYRSTVIRYPYIYGPFSLIPNEWHVIKRARDGRRRWITPGGGLGITTRSAAANAVQVIGLAIDQPDVSAGQIYQAADDRQYTAREWTTMVAQLMGHEFEFVDIPFSVFASSPVPGMGTSLRAAPEGGGPRMHALLSNEKARSALGYRDVVSPREWLRKTVEHWIAHPPPVDGIGNHLRPDEFDYELEDRILAWWDRVRVTAPDEAAATIDRRHPYPHPKQPGEDAEGCGSGAVASR